MSSPVNDSASQTFASHESARPNDGTGGQQIPKWSNELPDPNNNLIHHGELAGKNGSGNQKIDGDKQAQISVDKGLMGIVPESTGPQVDNISSGSYFEVVTACGNSSINPSDHLIDHGHGLVENSNQTTVAVVNHPLADDDVTSNVSSSSDANREVVEDVVADLTADLSFIENLVASTPETLNVTDCELELRSTDEILAELQTENRSVRPETKQTDEAKSDADENDVLDQMPTSSADATDSPNASGPQATASSEDSSDGSKSHEDYVEPQSVRIDETENAQSDLNRSEEVINDESEKSGSSKSKRTTIAAPEFAEREQHNDMARKRKHSIGGTEYTEDEIPPAQKRARRSELDRLQEIANYKDFADVFSLARGSRRSLTKAKFGATNNNSGKSKTSKKSTEKRGRRSC